MVCSNVKYTKHSTDTVYLKRQCISLFYLWLHPQLLDTWSYILCFLYFVFLEDYYSFRSSPLTRSTKKPELFNLCVCVCVCACTHVYVHDIYIWFLILLLWGNFSPWPPQCFHKKSMNKVVIETRMEVIPRPYSSTLSLIQPLPALIYP